MNAAEILDGVAGLWGFLDVYSPTTVQKVVSSMLLRSNRLLDEAGPAG